MPAVDIPLSALSNPWGNRRTVRGEVNPMDKATVVSIFPKYIKEYKYTLHPGEFEIAPGTYDKPALLVVGSSSWWLDRDPDQPLIEIPQSSIIVADSIVKDYCNGIVGCDMGDSMPGLYFIPGNLSLKQIVTEYKALLDKAKAKQDNWFRTLVKIADIYWARSNGNPVVIMEDMRLAANELGLQREWVKNYQPSEVIRCVACGNMRNPMYPVCATCKYVDQTHPLAKDLKFAV